MTDHNEEDVDNHGHDDVQKDKSDAHNWDDKCITNFKMKAKFDSTNYRQLLGKCILYCI